MKIREAIDILKDIRTAFIGNTRKAIDTVIAALEKQEKIDKDRWVMAADALPDRPEQVLVYARSVHFVLAKYKEIRTPDGEYVKKWVVEDAYSTPQMLKHDVIAWQPLHEPV